MAQLRAWQPTDYTSFYNPNDPFGDPYGGSAPSPYTDYGTSYAPEPTAAQPSAPAYTGGGYAPPSVGTKEYNDLYSNVMNWYNQYLGRQGSHDEIYGWVQNPYGSSAIEAGIKGSPEASAYASQPRATAPSAPAPSAPPTGGTNTSTQAPIGFALSKWADPSHLTDKYVVGRMLASGASADDVFSYLIPRGYERAGTDKVRDIEGEGAGDIFDFLFDEEGQRRPQWTRVGGPGHEASVRPSGVTAPGAGTFPNFSGARLPGTRGVASGVDSMGGLSESILRGWQDYLSPERRDARRAGAIEGARETMERGRKVQLRNMQATLADRGLLSEPGIVQGPEISSLARLEESIAPVYSQALREALADADQTTLSALQSAGSYQGMVTSLALQELGQDLDFQKFLAGHGLDQARLQFEIENGNINNVLALFQLYLNAAKIAADGYV